MGVHARAMKILHAVGARPNFMKVAPVMREVAQVLPGVQQVLVHTGQHYDDNMSRVFFEELDLPRPDIALGVGSGSHAQQTGRIMMAFEPVLLAQRPDWVVVVGDVNSTLACALTAAKLGVPVAHVEAGLRSFDRTMPEEYNRLLTDQIAGLLFTPSRDAGENLLREGIPPERIHFVGNVMIDTLVHLLPRTEGRRVLEDLRLVGAGQRDGGAAASRPPSAVVPYLLVTLHRPSSVDDPAALGEIMAALEDLSGDLPVVFPVHPRTRERLAGLSLKPGRPGGNCLHLLEPLGYLDFLALERHAAAVLTDSGGVQEETTYLGVPCLTVRPNTERPITIAQGTNRLVRAERAALAGAVRSAVGERHHRGHGRPPELWDGQAARRIAEAIGRARPAADPPLPPLPLGRGWG